MASLTRFEGLPYETPCSSGCVFSRDPGLAFQPGRELFLASRFRGLLLEQRNGSGGVPRLGTARGFLTDGCHVRLDKCLKRVRLFEVGPPLPKWWFPL